MQFIYLQAQLQTGNAADVVTLASGQSGSSLQCSPYGSALDQLWQYYGGNLVSALNANWAIAATAAGEVTIAPLMEGDLSQVWTILPGPSTPLINLSTLQALTIPTDGGVITTSAYVPFEQTQLFSIQAPFNTTYYLLTTVTNATPNDLFINGAAVAGSSALSSTYLPLVSGAELTFWSYYGSDGLNTSVAIWDSTTASNSVASFNVHYNYRSTVYFANTNWIHNYVLGDTSTTSPSSHSATPATAAITITYSG